MDILPDDIKKKILTDWVLLKQYEKLYVYSNNISIITKNILTEIIKNELEKNQIIRRIHNYNEYRKFLIQTCRYDDLDQTNMKHMHLNTLLFDKMMKIDINRDLIRFKRTQQKEILTKINKFPQKYINFYLFNMS